MLHSRVLRYIDEVARCGSIRAAGERLNVASSSINKHVLQLEQWIGEPLFERMPRGLKLTPAGEILIAHVRRTMKEFSQVESEIRDLKGLTGGEVVVATMNGLAGSIVAKAAASFGVRHPRLKISIRIMLIPDLIQAVLDGEVDIGFAYNLTDNPRLEKMVQMNSRLGAVVSTGHPIANLRSVSLSTCLTYPLIFADKTMLIRQIVLQAFETAQLEIEPSFETNSIEAMKNIAANSDGIAFLSKYDIIEEHRDGTLAYLPISDASFGKNSLSLIRRTKTAPGLASSMFAEEIIRSLGPTNG